MDSNQTVREVLEGVWKSCHVGSCRFYEKCMCRECRSSALATAALKAQDHQP